MKVAGQNFKYLKPIAIVKEFLVYAKNGVIINLLWYLFYIIITYNNVTPIIAISITYPIGLISSFYFHKIYTFKNKGKKNFYSLLKGVRSYLIAVLVNTLLLHVFHNTFSFPHQVVQLLSIAIISILLYYFNKFFVFNDK